MMDFRKLLRKTKYKNHIDCIVKFFVNGGIVDLKTLQSAPATLGHVCGCDIYDVVNEILLADVELSEEEATKEAVKTSRTRKKVEEEIKEEKDV